jgi:hypothetical protein
MQTVLTCAASLTPTPPPRGFPSPTRRSPSPTRRAAPSPPALSTAPPMKLRSTAPRHPSRRARPAPRHPSRRPPSPRRVCGLAGGPEEEHVEEERDHAADPLARIRVHGHLAPKPPPRRCSPKSSSSAFVIDRGEDADTDALLVAQCLTGGGRQRQARPTALVSECDLQ